MSLAAINSQYTGLNGLSGYGYTGGIYSDAYVDTAIDSIENGYEINATQNSYVNKGSVSSSSFAQQCQAIEYLLQEGRTDAAMEKYDDLYEDMASNSYYAGYTENEIKTLLQEKYLDATGSTIVSAIDNTASGDFVTGVQSSIPLFGALFSNNSSEDFIAEATGTETSGISKLTKATGVATGTAMSAVVGAGVAKFAKGAASSSGSGILSKAADGIKSAFKSGNKKTAIAGACVAGALALGTYVVGKLTNKSSD